MHAVAPSRLVALVGAVGMFACGGSATLGSAHGSGDALDASASADSSPNDAMSDVNAASFGEPGVALANLRGAPIDFCFRPPGANDWIGPVFAPENNVPDGRVSVKRPVPIESQVEFIGAGTSCNVPPLFPPGSVTNRNVPRVTVVVRGQPIDDVRRVAFKPAEHLAAKEMVYYGRVSRQAVFQPNGTGVVTLDRGGPTPLDPGLTGTLTLVGGSDPPLSRPMKTADGIILIIESPTKAIVCDLLAPPDGHLVRCGDDVRAP